MSLNFFFDIDGTLLPVGKPVPDDTLRALESAKKLGHRLFFCTGRSPYELTDDLRRLPFDGGVFSAGARVMLRDDVIFNKELSREQLDCFLRIVGKYNLLWLAQCDDGTYMTREAGNFYSSLSMKVYSRNIAFDGFHYVDGFPMEKRVYKLFILSESGLVLKAREELEGPFHTVNNTNGLPPQCAAEVMNAGISKEFGIRILTEHLGDGIESTVGVGDGENDIEMIDVCSLGIAMGNACDELKAHADFVVSDIDDGGLAQAVDYALKRLG